MTDVMALKKAFRDSGMTTVHIAEQAGILRETLYSRMRTGDFKLSEICALSKVLRLSKEKRDKIFFADNCELKSAKSEEG